MGKHPVRLKSNNPEAAIISLYESPMDSTIFVQITLPNGTRVALISITENGYVLDAPPYIASLLEDYGIHFERNNQ